MEKDLKKGIIEELHRRIERCKYVLSHHGIIEEDTVLYEGMKNLAEITEIAEKICGLLENIKYEATFTFLTQMITILLEGAETIDNIIRTINEYFKFRQKFIDDAEEKIFKNISTIQ